MNALAIGPLSAEEREDAVALWDACGLTRPWNDPRADAALAMRGPSSTVLAGRAAGALAATVMVGFDGHRGWIYYLAVAPAHRRRGHGAAMMAATEAWLHGQGAPKAQLMVRAGNAAATNFYAAIGYEPSDVLVMQRWLAGGAPPA